MLGDQDGWGTNGLSKAESILGTGMSQNLSRGRRHAWSPVDGGLVLALPNGLEIRGIEANNLGLVRDLLGMLA